MSIKESGKKYRPRRGGLIFAVGEFSLKAFALHITVAFSESVGKAAVMRNLVPMLATNITGSGKSYLAKKSRASVRRIPDTIRLAIGSRNVAL